MKKLITILLMLISLTSFAQGTRPYGWWVQGDAYNGWSVNGVWNYVSVNGWGYSNAWFYAYTYMRWPGIDNGMSRTIWFRTGLDDRHELNINGQPITRGDCCYYAYGSYTAKPGDIVKLEFWSYNGGGGNWIWDIAWNPDGNGYVLLGGNDVSYLDSTYGGGSAWYSSDITNNQTTTINNKRSNISTMTLGNKIYIEEKIGTSGSNVNIEQSGNHNTIQGLSSNNAIIDGNNNTINIKQGSVLGKNLIQFNVVGNTNNVTLWQARNITNGLVSATDSGGHYVGLDLIGNNNTVINKQENNGGSNSGHFSTVNVIGDNNTFSLKQTNSNDKKFFGLITGNYNVFDITQSGNGTHYIDLMTIGNGHGVNITQKDNGTHKATITLQNAGGASNLTLLQQGATGQTYSILQQCANLQGCSVNVIQGNSP